MRFPQKGHFCVVADWTKYSERSMSINTSNKTNKISASKISDLEVYTESVSFLERLHRLLLDMLKSELEQRGLTQVNNIQALLLYNIGDSEFTAGELRSRGHYLGSNVSYNLKKLVEVGFIHHERSASDRRSVRVRLTPAGQTVRNLVYDMYMRQCNSLKEDETIGQEELKVMNRTLQSLEAFWQAQLNSRR